jgi:hypothetical protein
LPVRSVTHAIRRAFAVSGAAACFTGAVARANDDLPTGGRFASDVERPLDEPGTRPACSFRYPVCVHGGKRTPARTVLGVLSDLERAASAIHGAMGLPLPLEDGKLGGGPAFDLYLVPSRVLETAAGRAVSVLTARDDVLPAATDRASAFALLRQDAATGCVRQNLAARALASAIGWRVDAGEDAVVRESNAAYLAEIVAPCGVVTSDLIDDFQAHPERSWVASGSGEPASSVALPWYLDATLGGAATGAVPMALGVIGAQRTEPGSWFWNNEPDLFDALRGSLKARTPPLTLDDLWMELAIARLFMGARDDGVHFPESAWAGNFGRIRFDWSLPYASLPRRVSPEKPIDPAGATYLWIDLRGAPAGARLAFHLEWEGPVLFRWALVRVDRDGREASRVLVTPQQKSTSAEKNLDGLDGLAGVALIGVNVGDLRIDDPFDPDQAPYEPHGYVVTVASAP